MLNLHLADEILQLMESKYEECIPAPSVKFDRTVLGIEVERELCEATEIEIEDIDTISASLREINNGHKVLALNMANAYRPGGGFLSGAKAQEEDLFRCTNLSKALTEDMYPMRGTEIICSPKIHILRDAEYQDLESPKTLAFCSIAAHRDPHIDMCGMLPNHVYNFTKCKIHMMFQIALIQKCDCLVLGALGCGAFHNPPYEIAKMFCEICTIYAQKFKKIVFAVKSGSDNRNCDIFQQAFLETFTTELDEGETMVSGIDLESDPDILYHGIRRCQNYEGESDPFRGRRPPRVATFPHSYDEVDLEDLVEMGCDSDTIAESGYDPGHEELEAMGYDPDPRFRG
jgi:uncharacterized protein (TIGR02452 family)